MNKFLNVKQLDHTKHLLELKKYNPFTSLWHRLNFNSKEKTIFISLITEHSISAQILTLYNVDTDLL